MDIFHYNEKSKEYKTLSLSPVDDGSGCFISIINGSKSSNYKNRLTLKLSKQELAYLILEAKKIYDKL